MIEMNPLRIVRGWVPKRNIKGEGEILEYIKELEGDTSWRSWCSNWANKFKNIKRYNYYSRRY